MLLRDDVTALIVQQRGVLEGKVLLALIAAMAGQEDDPTMAAVDLGLHPLIGLLDILERRPVIGRLRVDRYRDVHVLGPDLIPMFRIARPIVAKDRLAFLHPHDEFPGKPRQRGRR